MISWHIESDTGAVRTENQDKAAVFHNNGIVFAVLCDGMGGHKGGSHASRIAIEVFEEQFARHFPFKLVAQNASNLHEAMMTWYLDSLKKIKSNMTKYADIDSALLDMGTTVVSAVILQNEIIFYNIGDSRAYVFYNGRLQQITKDHNIRNHYIDEFGYTDEQAATMMGAAALTSALGPKKRTNVEQFVVNRNFNGLKYIVLTSDGIHDYIAVSRFTDILEDRKEKNPLMRDKLLEIIKTAIKGKSSDNLTGVLVDLEGGQ